MSFEPRFTITPTIASSLMRIEAARQAIDHLPITPSVLASLRESARLFSTHYSTLIEGNRLTQEQVTQVIAKQEHFPGRERDEKEVLGYYAALAKAEQLAARRIIVTEKHVQTLHALVMAGGNSKVKPSAYRDGQNVIRDSRSKSIAYMPPEAKDVPMLMKDMVTWMKDSEVHPLPCPIRAGITHYQFATIHPYYDGNGRTARLLTTLILHLGGYDLKGLYSLEEYYARNLGGYYEALTIGRSHNYYMGRAEADITRWIEYFCAGAADSFDNVRKPRRKPPEQVQKTSRPGCVSLIPASGKCWNCFATVTLSPVETLKSCSPYPSVPRNLLTGWTEQGFLLVSDPARKSRKYGLASDFRRILIDR